MSHGGFDPYKKWLAIPPEEQPPNHYRLLSVPLYEHDLDSIENAADRQMMLVRTFATGKHGDLSQKILNEVSAAKLVLLNAEKKATYDAQLKKKLAPKTPAATIPTTKPLATAKPVAKPPQLPVAPAPTGERFKIKPSGGAGVTGGLPRKKSTLQQPVVIVGLAAVFVVLVGLGYALSRGADHGDVVQGEHGPNTVVVDKGKTRAVTPPGTNGGQKKTASPEITKPVGGGNVHPGDWRVRCLTGDRWTDFPLEKMTTEVNDGVLTATNTTGIHTYAFLYIPILLDGDFRVVGEYKGQPKDLIGINVANGELRSPHMRPPDHLWHPFRVERSGNQLIMEIDGKPRPIKYNEKASVDGYFFVGIDRGQHVSLRNVRIEVGSD